MEWLIVALIVVPIAVLWYTQPGRKVEMDRTHAAGHCDMQERISLHVAWFMGGMGVFALGGIIFGTNHRPEVMALLGGVVGSAMSGLPSLLARLSNKAQDTGQPAGTQEDPSFVAAAKTLPVKETGKK